MRHGKTTHQVIGCAMRVHRVLGPGFLESVYQSALALELRRAGMDVETERRISVTYRGVVVGEFVADMLVEKELLIENKAVIKIIPAHEVQLVNYLTATGLNFGVVLNFGPAGLEFKRKVRLYPPPSRVAGKT